MQKQIATQKAKAPQPQKADPLEGQKDKLVKAWEFKSVQEGAMRELKEKFDALTEDAKQVQAKHAEASKQKHDADVVIETLAGILRDFGVDPQAVLNAAFAQPEPADTLAEPEPNEPVG